METECKIYDQHRAAFDAVSAWVVLSGANEMVAKVSMKFPRDGAGRLYCYFHVLGSKMVRGWASGGGYDKRSAAAVSAARLLSGNGGLVPENVKADIAVIKKALEKDAGYDWTRELENAGYKVIQAV